MSHIAANSSNHYNIGGFLRLAIAPCSTVEVVIVIKIDIKIDSSSFPAPFPHS